MEILENIPWILWTKSSEKILKETPHKDFMGTIYAHLTESIVQNYI